MVGDRDCWAGSFPEGRTFKWLEMMSPVDVVEIGESEIELFRKGMSSIAAHNTRSILRVEGNLLFRRRWKAMDMYALSVPVEWILQNCGEKERMFKIESSGI